MATYSTDLTTLTTAESGTWTEFNSPYNGGGSPGLSGENFIQGTDCYAQNTGKANGLEISCVYNHGSGVTYAAGEVVFAWVFYSVGTNLETYANSGWRFGIGASTANWNWWRIGGSDYGRNPYGGWMNVAIDPTDPNTLSTAIGSGTGTTYQYYGNVPFTIAEVTKGDPVAVDAIRTGRGEISMTGTGVTFAELAQYNDYNAGGTPPGTSSTSVDTGRHRLGLFQEQGGTYLWKGLMSVGTTASSVTFTDSNVTIVIDDAPNTYAGFNKVEFNNASSTVNWTNITFISTSSTTVSDARFEMIDNATVNLTSCSFNGIDTMILLSNATLDGCVFNESSTLTVGGATIQNCAFNSPSNTAMSATPAQMASVTNNTFVSAGTGYAINLGTVDTTAGDVSINWTNTSTGYGANETTNAVILVNVTGGNQLIINDNDGDNVTVNNTGGNVISGTGGAANDVRIVSGQKTLTVTGFIDGSSEIRVRDGSVTLTGGYQNNATDPFTMNFTAFASANTVTLQISTPGYEYITKTITLFNSDVSVDVTTEMIPDPSWVP